MDDWHANPVVTTIDSFSVPVTEIGFPSVTVCSDSRGLLDPMNYIEKVLNHVDVHETPNDTESGQKLHDLYDMLRLRLFDTAKGAAEKYDPPGHIIDSAYPLRFATLLQENVTTSDAMWARAQRDYGYTLRFEEFLNFLLYDLDPDYDLIYQCQYAKDCPETFRIAESILLDMKQIFPGQDADFNGLGTLLTQTMPEFGMMQVFKYAIPQQFDPLCFLLDMDREYQKIQDFLADMALDAGIGLDTTIFEIVDKVSEKVPWSSFPYAFCNRILEEDHECMPFWENFDFLLEMDSDNVTKCLNFWTEGFEEKLLEVMKVMKFSKHGGTSLANKTHLLSGLMDTTFSKYPYRDLDLFWPDPEVDFDPLSLIPHCEYKLKSAPGIGNKFHCNLFRPLPTDNGICHTFNAESFDQIYNPSEFTSILSQAYEDEFQLTRNSSAEITTRNHQLKFWLDSQASFTRGEAVNIPRPDYYISIGNKKDAFSFKQRSTKIRPGHQTIVKVTPYHVESDEALETLSMEERKCAFPHEISLNIFQEYSQEACHFECGLEEARDICGCTPWNLPFSPGKDIRICDLYGYACTTSIIGSLDLAEKCQHCIQDCNEITYSVVEKEIPLNPTVECKANQCPYITAKTNALYKDYMATTKPLLEHKTWHDFWRATCLESYESGMALVEVEFASSKFTRAKQSVAMTLGDKIANLGELDLGCYLGQRTIITHWFDL